MIIKWSEQLATGINEIDEQHKELLRRVEAIYEASQQGRGRDHAFAAVRFLDAYVRAHFSCEERAMARNAYPGLAQHRSEHEDLARKVAAFDEHLASKGSTVDLVVRVNHLVTEWLITHIRKTDRAFADFLRARAAEATVEHLRAEDVQPGA